MNFGSYKLSSVSATHTNSGSDTFSRLARILMASEEMLSVVTVSVGKQNL